jgi:hypothetical protein
MMALLYSIAMLILTKIAFPMIPSGKPHNQMILGPNDKEEK